MIDDAKEMGIYHGSVRNAFAGIIGGFTSSLIMHPLDVVTTRMQAQDGRTAKIPKYSNPISALILIARMEGVKKLYAGVVPHLVGSTTNWGVYFFGYNYSRNKLRRYLRDRRDYDEAKDLGPLLNLVCATLTGCVSAVITQPIWLAKTRLQLQHGSNVQYRGMAHCLYSVAKKEGITAIFRGLIPSLFLVSHIALHFMAYEELKRAMQRFTHKEHLSPDQTVVCASTAKLFATVATYPSQVVRTRLQLQQTEPTESHSTPGGRGGTSSSPLSGPPRHYYKGVTDTFSKILQFEGVRGLYKGLLTNFMRVIPTTAITFVVYETVAHRLGART